MAGQMDHYDLMIAKADGLVRVNAGSRDVPKQVTLTSDVFADDIIKVPAGDTITLWEYGVGEGASFHAIRVEIVSDYSAETTAMQLAWRGDSHTSGVPSGSDQTWNTCSLCAHTPFYLNTAQCLTNPTPATHATSSPLAASGEVLGIIDKIEIKNPTSNDHYVRLSRAY